MMLIASIVIGFIVLFAVMIISALYLLNLLYSSWSYNSSNERQIRNLLVARISTLENKLLSHNWEVYSNMQYIPDEIAKASWAERQDAERSTFANGETLEDRIRYQSEQSGSDLEGMAFEGPIVG